MFLTPPQVEAAERVLRADRELKAAQMALSELLEPSRVEAELELAAYLSTTHRPSLRLIPGGLSESA